MNSSSHSQPCTDGSLPVLKDTPAPSAAHTPGPWLANSRQYEGWNFEGGYLGTIKAADGSAIYSGPSSFHSLRGHTEGEAAANARLIAAAPELLGALETLTYALERAWPAMTGLPPIVSARNAIAKATQP